MIFKASLVELVETILSLSTKAIDKLDQQKSSLIFLIKFFHQFFSKFDGVSFDFIQKIKNVLNFLGNFVDGIFFKNWLSFHEN